MDDDNPLLGRLKRYASVSNMATSFAARLVGERFFGLAVDDVAQAQALTKAFGSLKGPAMKIAQFLATVPDAIPDAYAQEFLQLQSEAPSMGWPFVKRRMVTELGSGWMNFFQDFAPEASAAASLGQVHKAILLTGEEAACKLQYPNMAISVEADLNQLNLALKIFEGTSAALGFDDVLAEISARLQEELDYELEAKHMTLYGHIFADHPMIHVPQPHGSLSTKRLLTMDWLQGTPLKALDGLPQESRNQLASQLFHAWYHPFYTYGVIHGDPHLGNYTFREDRGVNLLDFGCIRKFEGAFVAGVLQLFYALLDNRLQDTVAAYESWGFKNLTREKVDILNLWARMLYEPLMDDRVRPIQKDNRGLQGKEMLEKVYKELKRLGGVTPPREFVFMDRAAVGIGSACMHLKAEVNWHRLFMGLIQDFDASTLAQKQAQALQKVGLDLNVHTARGQECGFSS